ncbi:hypothetical protein MRX96_036809 [Rhipicephalus microplus]
MMSQRSSSDLPQPASTLAKMAKGFRKKQRASLQQYGHVPTAGQCGFRQCCVTLPHHAEATGRLHDAIRDPGRKQVCVRPRAIPEDDAPLCTAVRHPYPSRRGRKSPFPRDSNGDFKQCERYEPLDAPASLLAASTSQAGRPRDPESGSQHPATCDDRENQRQ